MQAGTDVVLTHCTQLYLRPSRSEVCSNGIDSFKRLEPLLVMFTKAEPSFSGVSRDSQQMLCVVRRGKLI